MYVCVWLCPIYKYITSCWTYASVWAALWADSSVSWAWLVSEKSWRRKWPAKRVLRSHSEHLENRIMNFFPHRSVAGLVWKQQPIKWSYARPKSALKGLVWASFHLTVWLLLLRLSYCFNFIFSPLFMPHKCMHVNRFCKSSINIQAPRLASCRLFNRIYWEAPGEKFAFKATMILKTRKALCCMWIFRFDIVRNMQSNNEMNVRVLCYHTTSL